MAQVRVESESESECYDPESPYASVQNLSQNNSLYYFAKVATSNEYMMVPYKKNIIWGYSLADALEKYHKQNNGMSSPKVIDTPFSLSNFVKHSEKVDAQEVWEPLFQPFFPSSSWMMNNVPRGNTFVVTYRKHGRELLNYLNDYCNYFEDDRFPDRTSAYAPWLLNLMAALIEETVDFIRLVEKEMSAGSLVYFPRIAESNIFVMNDDVFLKPRVFLGVQKGHSWSKKDSERATSERERREEAKIRSIVDMSDVITVIIDRLILVDASPFLKDRLIPCVKHFIYACRTDEVPTLTQCLHFARDVDLECRRYCGTRYDSCNT